MKHNFKSFVSLMLVVMLAMCSIPMQAFAAENTDLPDATVTTLEPITLEDGKYTVFGGDLSGDLNLKAAMNFKANDTDPGDFANWLCDFYLTFDNMSGDSIEADGSYLAGNYGTLGWWVIPTDDIVIENGKEYPVLGSYPVGSSPIVLTYKDICESVKDFTAALHINPVTLLANPNMTVTLKLKMTDPANVSHEIGEPAVYTAEDLYGKKWPKATVTKLEPMTLKAGEFDVW